MPGLYRHPSPFATNPHWQTEIDLGPCHRPAKKGKKGNKNGSKNLWNESSTSELESRNDSKLNLRRSQRQEEELWGTGAFNISHSNQATNLDRSTSSVTRPPTARTAKTNKSGMTCYSAINPPINDQHPATVVSYESKEDVMWMMQPPPPVKFMQGKERVKRGRSDTGASGKVSSGRGNNEKPAQELNHLLLNERLRAVGRKELAHLPISTESLRRISSDLAGRDRSRTGMPSKIVDGSSEDEGESRQISRMWNPEAARPHRQYLAPIGSDSPSPRTRSPSHPAATTVSKPSRRDPASRPPLAVRSSNGSIQPAVPPKALLNVAEDWDGEWELRFPEWAADRVNGELRHRWSMDF